MKALARDPFEDDREDDEAGVAVGKGIVWPSGLPDLRHGEEECLGRGQGVNGNADCKVIRRPGLSFFEIVTDAASAGKELAVRHAAIDEREAIADPVAYRGIKVDLTLFGQPHHSERGVCPDARTAHILRQDLRDRAFSGSRRASWVPVGYPSISMT